MAITLTQFSRFAGCGAKLGPDLLDKALCGLQQPFDSRVLSDFSHAEDCGVYQLSDDMALVQTVDFFPPVCDDPWKFGRIAAANALSDIYAMGATPITAVSIVGFPEDKLDVSHLRTIMEGTLDALSEANTALLGGHTVRDSEVKFGLCVNGVIHPKKIWNNNTWKDNDALILTKPIGVGLANTAVRAGLASPGQEDLVLKQMMRLNAQAKTVLSWHTVHACTDVTGFGLLGHLCEMAIGNDIGCVVHVESIPKIDRALEYARIGLIPAGAYTNKASRSKHITGLDLLDEAVQYLLFDPQTSGGLLAAVPRSEAVCIIRELQAVGEQAAIIGYTDGSLTNINVITDL